MSRLLRDNNGSPSRSISAVNRFLKKLVGRAQRAKGIGQQLQETDDKTAHAGITFHFLKKRQGSHSYYWHASDSRILDFDPWT